MNGFPHLLLLSIVLPALMVSESTAFQPRPSRSHWLTIHRTVNDGTTAKRCFENLMATHAGASNAALRRASSLFSHQLFMTDSADAPKDGSDNTMLMKKTTKLQSLRSTLRKATGFSFTVFRATLRGITGVSLTAVYASAVAATGLWIRKITSVILRIFPSGLRYFLQPLLVLYYAPLFMLRSVTGPTRQLAIARHHVIMEGWREAVEYAEKTEKDGYWPVVVTEDGYFELVAPPSPTTTSDVMRSPGAEQQEMADAMADTVEHAMEINDAAHSGTN